MDVSEYRKRYTDQLEAAERPSAREEEHGAVAALATLLDRDQEESQRLVALRAISRDVTHNPRLFDRLIELLGDTTEPASLRIAALDALQQGTFLVQIFAPKRPAYLQVLRSVVDDPDTELRRRAIGVLAREKDEYVQRRLLNGLMHPSKAVVPAAKAIQYLGYDVHTAYFPLLRRIVERPPSVGAKREAIRLLSADPKSRPLLTKLLTDRQQPSDVRNMSALALQALAPARFEGIARKIALDDDEDDRLRATSLSALAHFAKPDTTARQRMFSRKVQSLHERARSPEVKRATKTFMTRASG